MRRHGPANLDQTDVTRGLQRIGKYQVERRLGSGSFATVWLAYDPDLDARVAIKILANNWADDAEVKRRFQQEARMLFRLSDPRVVKVYTTGEHDDGCPYFVMDYADRGALEQRIVARQGANSAFSVQEALAISKDIAECVAVIHRAGIVHRDLKPSNVLFISDPTQPAGERMLLGDFGIARSLEGGSRSTIVAGSPYYMAPEQAEEATARHADHRADIYACAVILYELLAGQVPYPFATISEIRRAQETGQRTPLRALRANLPASLERVVDRGMQVDPAQRYPNMDAWTSALEAELAALGAGITPAGADATILNDDGVETFVADSPPPAPPGPSTPKPEPAPRLTPQPQPSQGEEAAAARPMPPPRGGGSQQRLQAAQTLAAGHSSTLDQPVTAGQSSQRRPRRWPWLVALLALFGGGVLAYNAIDSPAGNNPTPTAGTSLSGFATVTTASQPTATTAAQPTATTFVASTPTFAPLPTATTAIDLAPETLVVADTMDGALFSVFPTFSGVNQSGEFVDGYYEIINSAGQTSWVSMSTEPVQRGYASVDFSIYGDGSAGIVARDRQQGLLGRSFETCWVTSAGSGGCAIYTALGWQTLFTVPNGSFTLVGEDRLTVQIDAGWIQAWVNEDFIGQAQIDATQTGYWGILSGNYSGTSIADFDNFTLVRYNDLP
ncbi:MAG: hypothetical protein DCC58_02250 [Chloroflexi bacterium]|nr:MAG: hypothetical protein DCC58_02250 [Chloroflexota bacterium]